MTKSKTLEIIRYYDKSVDWGSKLYLLVEYCLDYNPAEFYYSFMGKDAHGTELYNIKKAIYLAKTADKSLSNSFFCWLLLWSVYKSSKDDIAKYIRPGYFNAMLDYYTINCNCRTGADALRATEMFYNTKKEILNFFLSNYKFD